MAIAPLTTPTRRRSSALARAVAGPSSDWRRRNFATGRVSRDGVVESDLAAAGP